MKNKLKLFLASILLSSTAFSQDSSYISLVKLPDTISVKSFIAPLESANGGIGFVTERFDAQKLREEYDLLDSIPEHHIYLYSDNSDGNIRAFLITYEATDTARGSWISTNYESRLQNFEVASNGKNPIIELRYLEEMNSSEQSAEFEISAFFGMSTYPKPFARVVRKIWETKHGSYDPACKDYRFYSIEFSREVFVSGTKLYVKKGKYKHSSNIDCKVSNESTEIAGGVYEAEEEGFIRK